MELLFQILALIAIVSFIVLTFVAIIAIKNARTTLDELSKDFKKLSSDFAEIKVRSIETFDDAKELKIKAIETLSRYDKVSESIIETSDNVKNNSKRILNTFEPYSELIDEVYYKIAPPVKRTTTTVRAISKAINAFMERLSR
jgi:uncharacterized protein YoxC